MASKEPDSSLAMSRESKPAQSKNRSDEWEIEQGFHSASLPILDQTTGQSLYIKPFEYKSWRDDLAIKSVGDPRKLFQEEREGWEGYIEWENYPEKKVKARKILESQSVRQIQNTTSTMLMHSCSSHHPPNFRWARSQVGF